MIDVYVVVEQSESFMDVFARAGADYMTAHMEAMRSVLYEEHPPLACHAGHREMMLSGMSSAKGSFFAMTSCSSTARASDLLERKAHVGTCDLFSL